MMHPLRLLAPLCLVLAGCASLAPEADVQAVQTLSQAQDPLPSPQMPEAERLAAVRQLLAQPLDADRAVRLAWLNNPGLQASWATLLQSDATRVLGSSLPAPHLSLSRLAQGPTRDIERSLSINLLGLLTLPWQAQVQSQRHELARLQAAQSVVLLAAQTRKAWVTAVAAAQTASYLADVQAAAEAGAEMAGRMGQVGHWSRLQQSREQALLLEASAQHARARHAALAAREQLTRLLGLWGQDTGYQLPERLPALPPTLADPAEMEGQALRQRLDLRAAVTQAQATGTALGLSSATAWLGELDLGRLHNSAWDGHDDGRSTHKGWEIGLTLPLLGPGQAREAQAQADHRLALARVRQTAVLARSEVREAWHAWRTAHELARLYQDQVVPLRKTIQDETLLRYNGMLSSVWDLLAETRAHSLAITQAIAAQRDFWLADVDLHTTLTGTSPGALSAWQTGTTSSAAQADAH